MILVFLVTESRKDNMEDVPEISSMGKEVVISAETMKDAQKLLLVKAKTNAEKLEKQLSNYFVFVEIVAKSPFYLIESPKEGDLWLPKFATIEKFVRSVQVGKLLEQIKK